MEGDAVRAGQVRRRRLAIGAAITATVVALAIGMSVGGPGPSPPSPVEVRPDGSVVVALTGAEDPRRLQDALDHAGLPARVVDAPCLAPGSRDLDLRGVVEIPQPPAHLWIVHPDRIPAGATLVVRLGSGLSLRTRPPDCGSPAGNT